MSSPTQESVSRIYTINLGRAHLTPRYRRTDRVVNMIREFARKHMKTSEVKLDQELNRYVWKKGKANPPRKLRVRMLKDEDGVVIVSSYEEAPKKEKEEATSSEENVGQEPNKPKEGQESIPGSEEGDLKEQSKTKQEEPKKTRKGRRSLKAVVKKDEKKEET
ncbi:MAG: 60S ribosomal protein L31 [Thermoproteota archaeon]|nr:60S ribosomal protein L31 [Thermoproteota archaeon]